MGQANVRYIYDDAGEGAALPWMTETIEYVAEYNGENLLDDKDKLIDLLQTAQSEIEIAAGYESNAEIRRAIELRAMAVVRQHYESGHYQVVDKSKTESYDFACIKGDSKVLVEVKGTRTDGTRILLTNKEKEIAADPSTVVDLCVVHSITVTRRGVHAQGGTLMVYRNWNPSDHKLEALQYVCQLKEQNSDAQAHYLRRTLR